MDTIVVSFVDAVTAPIPFLASSGILLVAFGVLWAAFAAALVRDPSRVDAAWLRVRGWPLIAQAVAWLLLLPIMAGAWVWRTGWPTSARLIVVASLASWNLLMFLPPPA